LTQIIFDLAVHSYSGCGGGRCPVRHAV